MNHDPERAVGEPGVVEDGGRLPRQPIPTGDAALLVEEIKGLGIQQKNAQAWAGTIATIATISSVLGFTVKAEDLTSLASGAKPIAVLFGLVAVVLVAAATFYAGRAASGGVPDLAISTPSGQRQEILRQSTRAARDMRISYAATFTGVVAAAVGIAAAAHGPQEGLGEKRWLLSATPPADAVYCGQLAVQATIANLVLTPLDEPNGQTTNAKTFAAKPVAEFSTLEETTLCP